MLKKSCKTHSPVNYQNKIKVMQTLKIWINNSISDKSVVNKIPLHTKPHNFLSLILQFLQMHYNNYEYGTCSALNMQCSKHIMQSGNGVLTVKIWQALGNILCWVTVFQMDGRADGLSQSTSQTMASGNWVLESSTGMLRLIKVFLLYAASEIVDRNGFVLQWFEYWNISNTQKMCLMQM